MLPNHGNTSTHGMTTVYRELFDLTKKTFDEIVPAYPMDAKVLFEEMTIPNNSGITRRVYEQDFSSYARLKRDSEDAKKAQYGIGFYKDITVRRFALEFSLSYETRKWNDYNSAINNLTRELIQTLPNRINMDMSHRLSFADAQSYIDMDGQLVDVTTGDGLSLINSAHRLAHSSKTYSNQVPGNPVFDIGGVALEAAEKLTTTDILDNYGVRFPMKFDTIVTSDDPKTVHNVKKFLNSTTDINQANPNTINVWNGMYRHLVLVHIDTDAMGNKDPLKSERWFLVNTTGAGRLKAKYAVWEAPNMKSMMEEDFHNDDLFMGVRAAYGLAILSGKGIIGSMV